MKSSTAPRIRVALLEDDEPFCAYLAGLIAESGRYEIVATAHSAEAAARWPATLAPRLALVDFALPGATGAAATRDLLARFPALGVVILTGRADDDTILDAIRAGACGYVLKGTGSASILAALDDAAHGGAPMSPAIARRVLALMRDNCAPLGPTARPSPSAELRTLTPREHDVLALVAAGATDKEAAARLDVSVSAVKQHLANIYAKWRVRSRTEAAIKFTTAR
jgi:DNA-binding NarL/FixJ family response regulator